MSIVRIKAYGEFIGTGQNQPFHCETAAVGKANRAHPLVVANEFICARLALHVGLPVPAGGIVTTANPAVAPDGLAYVSMNAFPQGERPPPVDVSVMENRQWECAGITVFDAWIVSGDRHAHNIIYEPELGVPLMFIDFELSLTSHDLLEQVPFSQLLDVPISQIPNSMHDLVREYDMVARWTDRIMSLDTHTIDEVVFQARELGAVADNEAKRIIQLLVHRRDHLRQQLAAQYYAGEAFQRIDRWGLM